MEPNYNILIVEDEMMIASHIEQCLEEENFSCTGIAKSYVEAISYLDKYPDIDLILLDITLYGNKTGIDLAHTLNKDYKIPFFYLTSYSDRETLTALKETRPLGYLNKPVNEIELVTALQIAGDNLAKKKFTFTLGTSQYTIEPDAVRYVQSDHVYVELVLTHEKLTLRTPLSKILEILPAGLLQRVNRSIAINPRYIKRISGSTLLLEDESFKISPSCKANFS